MENVITVLCVAGLGGLTLLVKWVRLRGIRRIWYTPVGWPFRVMLSLLAGADNWQFRHAITSPFGITLMTWLITYFASEDYRPVYRHLNEAADFIDASALIYGMLAVLMELIGGRIVFWALEQWKKGKDAINSELRESREMMVAEVREDVLAEIGARALPEVTDDALVLGRAAALTEIRARAAELSNPEQFISLLDEMSNDEIRVDLDGTVWRRVSHPNGNEIAS